MATQSQAQAVKSLNTGDGKRQFAFKTISQKIDEIDVDVYRSCDPIKAEPSEGSSFFRDCLVEWRELNTAEDFISFYEEMLPLVQTLPQIILQKEFILSNLLSRLDMKGRLSLEPILRLIAALSRDLLEDFIPFLQKVADSMALLLSSGADGEPEIFQQILTSWSSIMMYLQKYLTRDIVYILKVTTKLRFYPKLRIQEFLTESISFLLRNTHDEQQLSKGLRKIMSEVVAKPTETRKNGAIYLLFYIMKGVSSKLLHSRAKKVMLQLLHPDIIASGDKHSEGSNPVVEVLITVVQLLSEELQPSEVESLLKLQKDEIDKSIHNGNSIQLTHLLSLFNSTLQIDKVKKAIDFEPVLDLAKLLIETFIIPKSDDQSSEVIDKILQLILCILDGLHSSVHEAALTELSTLLAPIFKMRNESFMSFINELLSKDPFILEIFKINIITVLIDLTTTSKEEALYLFIKFFENIQSLKFSLLEGKLKNGISNFFKEQMNLWIEKINDDAEFWVTDLPRIWGIVSCYSYMIDFEANPSLLMGFVEALDCYWIINSEKNADVPQKSWEALIGAGLASYQKLCFGKINGNDELPVDKFLYFAKKYKNSIHILSAVADFLDSLDASTKKFYQELKAGKTVDAFKVFSENLCHSDKRIRVLTLRILCHYESLNLENSQSTIPSENDMIIDDLQSVNRSEQTENVLHSLLAIEATVLKPETSRKVILFITKIQMDLSAGRICKAYIPLVFNAIIGIFHNRFSLLFNPAMECFEVLVSNYHKLVWELCMNFLKKCVSNFISHQEHSDRDNDESSDNPEDLVSSFNAFVGSSYNDISSPNVLSLLIKSLQKASTFVESQNRQIIPVFLTFLGYEVCNLSSVRFYNLQASEGKVWMSILEDWLDLLNLMRNPKSFYLSQFVKDVLQYRLLDENSPDVQMKVLECLLNWKDEFLVPYGQNLRNLVNPKTLRDELTRWSLSRESNLISEEHRDSLVPLVIRVLVPKVRKLKANGSKKASRKAVIAFLAALDIKELPLFFALLIKPLQTESSSVDEVDNFNTSSVLKHFTMDNIKSLSSKKIHGFLHVTQDILGVLDESRIKPVLDMLMGSVVRILASCSASNNNMCVDEEEESEAEKQDKTSSKQFKDLRSLCLKIISLVLNKFEDHDFSFEFWDIFFTSLKPLIDGFKQEGASSEKPSSLFVCFLAMSRSHKLVPLFQKTDNLVPDIFSILKVTTASEAIISCVLKFVENLLNLDMEVENGDNNVKGILTSNIDILVDSLHHLFTSKSTHRKSFEKSGALELNIFKLLPKYIKDPSIGEKFVNILLPSLTKQHHDWDSCVETLHIVQKMVPLLGSEYNLKIVNIISPLLIDASSDVRLAICDNLDALSKSDSSLVRVAKLLRDLNATSAMEIDEPDHEVINSAYEKINIDFFCSVGEEHARVILSHCVHDMSSKAYRDSAHRVLLLFVDFSEKKLKNELESVKGRWSQSSIQNTVNNFILKYMGEAMDKENSVKKEWMNLLREMALKLPNVANLGSIKALCSEDPEQDFFNNIVHIQIHRRARALLRFSTTVSSCHLSEVIINKVLVPLIYNMLLEIKDGTGEHLRSACIEALASISSSMKWKDYYALLNKCFREIKLKQEKQKVFLRLICSILDRYHFSDFSEIKNTNEEENKNSDIQDSLQENILPKIQKLLTLDSENVNVNISLVALKLLKLLPGNVLELQLPTIIHRVTNFLKNRLESVRDEARIALAAILKELGLEYLQFIVKVMRSTLTKGFEVHVLGYTLNFLLTKCLLSENNGKLDYCLEDLLYVVENDILGDVSEQKEVDKIASKSKEARTKKSFDTLQLIAQNVNFKSCDLKLMSPVTRHLEKQLTPKVKSKLESMLHHIASGIKKNPTVNQKDAFIFCYSLIEDHLNLKGKNSQSSHLITVFALQILYGYIKKMRLTDNKNELISFLDPFVKLLTNCLSSKFEDITSKALRCFSLIVKVGLPSLQTEANNIKSALFIILNGSVPASSQLSESCLRLLTVVLKSDDIKLSTDNIKMLLQLPIFIDLENNPSFVALSLLKEIMRSEIEVTEIYDFAVKVSALMLTSQVEAIRKKCSKILLQFLRNYLIKQNNMKRLQEHLDFMLTNLDYEHPTGREALLEMLYAIIPIVPDEFRNNQSKKIFLKLVVCLVNDSEKNVRSMAGNVIKHLFSKFGPKSHPLTSILYDTLSWYSSEKLQSTAAQVLGLFVEVMQDGFREYVEDIFVLIRQILAAAVRVFQNIPEDSSSGEATVPKWKEAYYSLVLFEKILLQFPECCLQEVHEEIWEKICVFLLHPHIWLRNISNRLIAMYFENVTRSHQQNNGNWIGEYYLMRPSRLFLLAASFCSQLKTSLTDESANNCHMQNIVFSIIGLYSMLGAEEKIQEFWSTIGEKDEEVLVKAFLILDSRKGRSMFASLELGQNGHFERNRYLIINSLLKKMGKYALDMEEVQMRIIFDSFKQISPNIINLSNEVGEEADNKDDETYAYQILLPIYKICEGFAGKVIEENLKQFAEEVRDSIKEAIGVENFVKVYSLVRKNLKSKRDKRRQGEKVMAVVNPMRNAKRKLRIAEKHKQNKKRKIMTMKFGKWRH